MAQGKKRSEQQWRDIIEEYFQSTLSVEQFAKQANISKSTLYKWLSQFRPSLDTLQKPFVSLPTPKSSSCAVHNIEFTYQTPAGATLKWHGTPPQDYLLSLIGRLP
jgi:transposase-like protein